MAPPAEAVIERTLWWDGNFVPWQDATVHLLSHSLQRGSLIFDYMSVHATPRGAAIFRLGDHLERLLASAELVGIPLELGLTELEPAVVETVRRNPGCTAVKVSAFLPSIEVDVVPADARVSVAIAAYDPAADILAHQPGAPAHRATARVWIEKSVRNRRSDILAPQAKVAANYASPMLAKWRAQKAGYDEILLIDEQGCVAEGPTTNVFLVVDGELLTPGAERVLLGVTRRSILEIARSEGLSVRETQVQPEVLKSASEVFLTGTTAAIWPVESVDDARIGEGEEGPVTRRLAARYREISAGRDPDFAHWLTLVGPG